LLAANNWANQPECVEYDDFEKAGLHFDSYVSKIKCISGFVIPKMKLAVSKMAKIAKERDIELSGIVKLQVNFERHSAYVLRLGCAPEMVDYPDKELSNSLGNKIQVRIRACCYKEGHAIHKYDLCNECGKRLVFVTITNPNENCRIDYHYNLSFGLACKHWRCCKDSVGGYLLTFYHCGTKLSIPFVDVYLAHCGLNDIHFC
jgi:hypothetical protein